MMRRGGSRAPARPASRTRPGHRAGHPAQDHQPQPQRQLHGDQRRQARLQPQPQARPGKELLTDLLRIADVVVEGYSPGTMDRMGFGWEAMRQINPRLVYVQQSGMGQVGNYGRMRSYGPTAQAFSGHQRHVGAARTLPPRRYRLLLPGLVRRLSAGHRHDGRALPPAHDRRGLLDRLLPGRGRPLPDRHRRSWTTPPTAGPGAATAIAHPTSPRPRAAPTAAPEQTAGSPSPPLPRSSGWPSPGSSTVPQWTIDPGWPPCRCACRHQDYLDALVTTAAEQHDPYQLMTTLQEAGVPAGVRADGPGPLRVGSPAPAPPMGRRPRTKRDRTLARQGAADQVQRTPPYIGGAIDRHGPNYGEDNDYVLGELLGFDPEKIAKPPTKACCSSPTSRSRLATPSSAASSRHGRGMTQPNGHDMVSASKPMTELRGRHRGATPCLEEVKLADTLA